MGRVKVGILALAIVVTPLVVQHQVRAENYMGIGYAYSINDVKAMFPGAIFEDVKPAWAKPGDRFLAITGNGIAGSIRILFQDERPAYSQAFSKEAADILAQQPDDKRYVAQWVRWVPDAPIAFSRLKSKFGSKFRFASDNQDFSTAAVWDNKGIVAPLTDDRQYASWVEFQFTPDEQTQGVRRRLKAAHGVLDAVFAASSSVPSNATNVFE